MTATTAVEQLVACGIMLLGIIFFGFVISTSQCAAPSMRHSVHAAAKLEHSSNIVIHLITMWSGGLRHACSGTWCAERCGTKTRNVCRGGELGRCILAGRLHEAWARPAGSS